MQSSPKLEINTMHNVLINVFTGEIITYAEKFNDVLPRGMNIVYQPCYYLQERSDYRYTSVHKLS